MSTLLRHLQQRRRCCRAARSGAAADNHSQTTPGLRRSAKRSKGTAKGRPGCCRASLPPAAWALWPCYRRRPLQRRGCRRCRPQLSRCRRVPALLARLCDCLGTGPSKNVSDSPATWLRGARTLCAQACHEECRRRRSCLGALARCQGRAARCARSGGNRFKDPGRNRFKDPATRACPLPPRNSDCLVCLSARWSHIKSGQNGRRGGGGLGYATAPRRQAGREQGDESTKQSVDRLAGALHSTWGRAPAVLRGPGGRNGAVPVSLLPAYAVGAAVGAAAPATGRASEPGTSTPLMV